MIYMFLGTTMGVNINNEQYKQNMPLTMELNPQKAEHYKRTAFTQKNIKWRFRYYFHAEK